MLAWCAARSAVVLLVGLVACAALARASAAVRRAVLVAALLASIAVPIVAMVGPSWRVEAPAALDVFATESPLEGVVATGAASPISATYATALAPESHVDLRELVFGVWIAGVLVLAARSISAQRRARKLVTDSEPFERGVRISDAIEVPCVVASTVLLPRSAETWTAERLRVVLLHECAHVQRRDALAQLVADLACALHWFDPLVWLVAARLRVEREHAADDAVLAAGVRPSSYAEELLGLAGPATAGVLAMAERTTLGARIVAILAPQRSRGALATRGTALVVASTLAIGAAIACASPRAAAAMPKPTDAKAQRAAEETLAALTKKWSAQSVAIVVLDAATGEVLADAGRTAAIVPGSTLKPITIAAALDTGAITANQKFECGPSPRRYGRDELRDASTNGTLDVAHLLAVSSNIGTSHIFDALGGDRLAAWLARFHLTSGAVPSKIESNTFAGANVAIGEAMTATPLELASAYAALASDGIYHAPAGGAGERIVSSATASQVMAMLETGVDDPSATGKLARVPGVHVAGKTGTADVDHHTYASFVGIADLPARRVVILVGVETRLSGVSGGSAAAPAFAQLVGRLR